MLKEDFIDLNTKLNENGILLSFVGTFSQEIIEELGEAIKNHLQSETNNKSNTYNVFSVFIEQTQNIRNYLSATRTDHNDVTLVNSGIVTIGKNNDKYFVYSGNYVEKSAACKLAAKINELNSMDKEQLKLAYKEQKKKPRLNENDGPTGAGLGLIDMARKATEVIEYSLISKNDKHDFFIMKVTI